MADQALLNQFEQRYQELAGQVRRLPLAFWRNVVIVLALMWACNSLARMVWLVFSPPMLPTPPVVAVQEVQEASLASGYSVDLAALQSLQTFGDGVEEAVEAPVETAQVAPGIEDNAAKTSLNLDLVGIVASNDPAQSSAVIAQGSNQKIYQIEDKLPAGNNVSLAKVLHDRVILNNNGKYESLWLYSEADFNVTYSYTNTASNDDDEAEEDAEPETTRIESKIKPEDVPKSISDVVRFSVHRENGQMVGFRIRPGKNRELFEQLGLEANDVVTSVNGIPIDNAQAIRDNYQQLKSATSADLEIRRGEETVYVNVSLDTTSE